MTQEPPVEVLPCDRSVAWHYADFGHAADSQERDRWHSGYYDNQPVGHPIRAFARHRQTHSTSLAGGGDISDVWQQAEENHRTYSETGDRENDIRFLTLGLTGEAGEVANFVKKRWRDGDHHDEAIRLEIADVCAYAFMLASTMGMSPADLIGTIAHKQQVFINKMQARQILAREAGS